MRNWHNLEIGTEKHVAFVASGTWTILELIVGDVALNFAHVQMSPGYACEAISYCSI